MNPYRLLVVIVSYKVPDLTVECLRSLGPEVDALPGVGVAVCENGTGPEAARQLGQVIDTLDYRGRVEFVTLPRNLGFTGGNNAVIAPALRRARKPDYLLLLNNDTLVRPGALTELVAFMDAHPRVGIAGSRLEGPDGAVQRSAFRFPGILSELDQGLRLGIVTRLLSRWVVAPPPPAETCRTDWVSGASMIVRREVFEGVGLLDEGLYTYFDDVDLCARAARAGWETRYVPASRVMHLGGQTTGIDQRGAPPKRRPPYWFLARRRCFLTHHGPVGTLLADGAFLLGFALWRLRRPLQGKPDHDPPHMLWDFFRHSVFCTGFRVRPVPNPILAARQPGVAPPAAEA